MRRGSPDYLSPRRPLHHVLDMTIQAMEAAVRAIIDGKRYDTETADEVAVHHSPHLPGDFYSFSETLYRTQRGRWFLVGEGNAASPYGTPVWDGRGPGERVMPFSDEEARDWLESREKYDALEAYFAKFIEDA